MSNLDAMAARKYFKISRIQWSELTSAQRLELMIDYRNSLVTSKKCTAPASMPVCKEEEATMNLHMSTQSIDQQRIDHLLNRLSTVRRELDDKLQEQFYINDDPRPKTPEEYVKRIQAGEFQLRDADGKDEYGNPHYYDNAYNYLIWRKNKADWKGYRAAAAELEKARVTAKDIIMVKSADDGLKALQDFEAWTNA